MIIIVMEIHNGHLLGKNNKKHTKTPSVCCVAKQQIKNETKRGRSFNQMSFGPHNFIQNSLNPRCCHSSSRWQTYRASHPSQSVRRLSSLLFHHQSASSLIDLELEKDTEKPDQEQQQPNNLNNNNYSTMEHRPPITRQPNNESETRTLPAAE